MLVWSCAAQVMGVIEALNSQHGFDASDEQLLVSMALMVADRLLPELIQDMVQATMDDHGMGDDEIAWARSTPRLRECPPAGPRTPVAHVLVASRGALGG